MPCLFIYFATVFSPELSPEITNHKYRNIYYLKFAQIHLLLVEFDQTRIISIIAPKGSLLCCIGIICKENANIYCAGIRYFRGTYCGWF